MKKIPDRGELSIEQRRVLRHPFGKHLIVTGAPGTGKTLLAYFFASNLRNESKKFKVLMFSNVLRSFFSGVAKKRNLIKEDVNTWLSFLAKFITDSTGVYYKNFQIKPFVYDWKKLNDHCRKKSLFGSFSEIHIIIDEVQDIDVEGLIFLKNMGCTLYCFGDINQKIDRSKFSFPRLKRELNVDRVRTLEENYRNSRGIADLAKQFWLKGSWDVDDENFDFFSEPPTPPSPGGDLPRMILAKTSDEEVKRILQHHDNFPDREVGVFLTKVESANNFFNAFVQSPRKNKGNFIINKEKKVQLYYYSKPYLKPEFKVSDGYVTVLTWFSSKGLEFDDVFIPSLSSSADYYDSMEEDQMFWNLMFVVCSRARESLTFLSDGNLRGQIKDVLQLLVDGGMLKCVPDKKAFGL